MSFKEKLKEIAAGKLSQLYFLTGEEAYFIRQAEKAIQKAVLGAEETTNLTVFYGDANIKELIMAVETIPFFGEKKLILVKETSLFKNT
ncbi:MAG: DNA polymerase III subunit delta, partial [Sporomusaceae bacterium]|nr:DNA polymerase III subunit delta [Sporomusaceae bacterium]